MVGYGMDSRGQLDDLHLIVIARVTFIIIILQEMVQLNYLNSKIADMGIILDRLKLKYGKINKYLLTYASG